MSSTRRGVLGDWAHWVVLVCVYPWSSSLKDWTAVKRRSLTRDLNESVTFQFRHLFLFLLSSIFLLFYYFNGWAIRPQKAWRLLDMATSTPFIMTDSFSEKRNRWLISWTSLCVSVVSSNPPNDYRHFRLLYFTGEVSNVPQCVPLFPHPPCQAR